LTGFSIYIVEGTEMKDAFRRFSNCSSDKMGSPAAFLAGVLVIVVWAALGPVFHFSDTWQLVINTGTTIITFLMVFLIQATQNRDARAMHLKLDELIRVVSEARNGLVAVEESSDEVLDGLKEEFSKMREEETTK
jgi:low affinity Fe/Cu permease